MKINNAGNSNGEGILFLFMLALFSFIFYIIGDDTATKRFQIESVKKGHAEWTVDEKGVSTFVWKNICQASK